MTDSIRPVGSRTNTLVPRQRSAPSGPDATLGLGDLRGRPAVLVFYPADWSPVCSDQLVLYQEIRPMLDMFNAQSEFLTNFVIGK